jgi:predicted small secreted protein
VVKFKRTLALVTVTSMVAAVLTGCGRNTGEDIKASMDRGETIALSVEGDVDSSNRQNIEWTELDQLQSYKEFRDSFDYTINVIKFGLGSKNGVIYSDGSGNWTGNNTLFNAYKNKEFVKNYANDSKVKAELKDAVNANFETSYNTNVGYIAAINTYFNIIPNLRNNGKADTDVIMDTLSRKDAMTAIVRCDTPVRLITEKNEFDTAFGEDKYNIYAYMAKDNSFLKLSDNSLNAYSYNSPITFGEAIYMIIDRYYHDELEATSIDIASVPGYTNLGDIWSKYNIEKGNEGAAYELETALQQKCIPDDIYRAMSLAYDKGIISSGDGWNESVSLGSFLTYLITTYELMYNDSTYPVNATTGKNEGNELIEEATEDTNKEEIDIGGSSEIVKEEVKKADEIDEILKKYADDINMTDDEIATLKKHSEGFNFEWVDTRLKVDYCEYLNLRGGPSTDYPILRSIPAGTETHVIAKCVENGWYRVIADGTVAYQCGYYFSDIQE